MLWVGSSYSAYSMSFWTSSADLQLILCLEQEFGLWHAQKMKQWIQTLSCYCRTASTVYYARFTVRCMLSSTVYWLALYAYWFFLFYYQSSLHNNIFTDKSVLPKIVLFEVQSGFWRLLPRGLLRSSATLDRLPAAEAVYQDLTLDSSRHLLFHQW